MSIASGRLVVLNRQGRPGKSFEVTSGLATLGRDLECHVRVLLPHVSRHHATVIVQAVQAVVRNECEGETLVNGRSVSVAALHHGDVISVGGRRMRWEYARQPPLRRTMPQEPALYPCATAQMRARRARGRAARSSAGAAGAAVHLALHLQHRASMPGNAGSKQVAIVQPQRRDTAHQAAAGTPRPAHTPRPTLARPRGSSGAHAEPQQAPGHGGASASASRDTPRQRQGTMSPRSLALMNTTKATLWIESRKTSPRRSGREHTPPAAGARRAASAGRDAPLLKVAVLRKAQSAHKMRVTKIEDPLKIDHTKQAAIMLMTGHTHKMKGYSPQQAGARNSPTFVVKKPSPVRKTPRSGGRKSARSPEESGLGVTPKRASTYENSSLRSSRRSNAGQSVSVLEITDTDARYSSITASTSKISDLDSPLPPSPKKSALKDPTAKKSTRKTESIKFDLSNLENYSQNQSNDVLFVTDTTSRRGQSSEDSASEDDLTLHYDSSSTKSPSPRKSIHSRSSSRTLDTLGLSESRFSPQSFMSAESQRAKKSLRDETNERSSSVNDLKSINTTANRSSKTLSNRSGNTTAFKTRILSPRTSNKNLESYSIVDLVSIDSNESGKTESMYNSVGSTRSSSIVFGTPHSSGRKTRSTIEPNLLGSSTPYVGSRMSRSHSSPNVSRNKSPNNSDRTSKLSRRSKSLTTPENTQKHISVNSTRISKSSRNRSRINDSDLAYVSRLDNEAEESPKSSRRDNRADKSHNISNISTSSSQGQRSNSCKSSPNKTYTKSPQNDRTISTKHKSPVLNTRSFLDSSQSSQGSLGSRQSQTRLSATVKRKTIGVIRPGLKGRSSLKSKSLNISKGMLSKSNVNQFFANNSGSNPQSGRRSSGKNLSDTTLAESPQNKRRSSGKNLSDTTFAESPQNKRRSAGNNLSDTTFAESPQNKRRSSGKNFKPNKTPNSPHNKSRSPRRKLTLNILTANNSQNQGTITPENVNTPEEIGTPILNIQRLLDSSQSSLRSQQSQTTRGSANKRKSVSLILTGKGRSKSINLSKRKSRSLRLSNDPSVESDGTDENALQPDNEDTVTPKSAVKLVHEAVKNKHSTAKKPQSKRSLIDNLNDSDIVKHLFNSPVKRKLSQSMTEFSRKRLFDEDEVAPKRPTRNTVALTRRTPNNSLLLDHTENITPEKFVSPLSTPSNSPNLTGIKRLNRKNTPENDLRNVKGVKGLLKTPRPRRSVRNDLTNVSGVKALFGKSPKNRSNNDLRRVSGVKSLFQSQIVAKNDLSDVRGVKNLFKRKSSANDLRNVSGVKKTLQVVSPKNDLTDVRGVRRLFRQQKQHSDLDVSGIEELFNESNSSFRDSDNLFDQLVGKPPIKAVYSKSFIPKKTQKQSKLRNTKSLQIPLDTIMVSPEEWIEQELKKRFDNKVEASTYKARKSFNKSSTLKANITSALKQLATDTVEGDAPILTSRVRNSTILKSRADITDMKKSVSESYSARKLPIKKRSLLDKSGSVFEKSGNKTNSNILPLKKRAVVHSTPVKGRFYDSTMNASELGRVSPIAVVEKTSNLENDTLRPTQRLMKNSPKSKAKTTLAEAQGNEKVIQVQMETLRRPRGGRAPSVKTIAENLESEKKTRQSPKAKGRRVTKAKNVDNEIQTNSPKTKTTRATKTKNIVSKETLIESIAKTRRARNNKEKGTPKASPKQRGRPKKSKGVIQNLEQSKPSPKTTRAAKASALNTLSTKSGKKVNTKVANTTKRRQSLVIGKKQPVMSPKAEVKATRKKKTLTSVERSSSQRKLTNVKEKSPKARLKDAVVVINRLSPRYKSKASKIATPKVKSPAATRSTRTKANAKSPKKSPGVVSKVTRKAVEMPEFIVPEPKRPRNTRAAQQPQEAQKKTPGKVDSKENAPLEPTGRNRRAKADVSVVPKTIRGQKRKLTEDVAVSPSKMAKSTRGRSNNRNISPKATKSAVVKATRRQQKLKTISPKATISGIAKGHGPPSNQAVTSPKASRGRRNIQTESPKATTSVISKTTRGKKEQVASSKATKTQAPKAKKTIEKEPNKKAQEDKALVRGRRAAAVAIESPPKTGRKRKISPVKAAPAKRARRGAADAPPSPAKQPAATGRSTRAINNKVSAPPTQRNARSRRR